MVNLEGANFNKYVVLKSDDIDRYVTEEGQIDLIAITDAINILRHKEGKKINKYLVINTDEPYANQVIDLMKTHGHWG